MLGLSIFYLIILGLCCIGAIRLALKVKRSAISLDMTSRFQSSEKWNVFSYWILTIYFVNNLIVETIAWYWYFYYPEINYSPIYAFGLIVSALTILTFFGIQSGSKIVSILFFIFFSLLLTAYFRDEQWSFESYLTFIFGLFHFSFLAIASAIFIARNLFRRDGKPSRFKIRFGVVYFVNCFLSLFIAVFTLQHTVYEIDCDWIFPLNYGLSLSFYTCCALILWLAANEVSHKLDLT